MILFFLLIITLLFSTHIRFSAYDFIKPVAEKSHHFCVTYLPQNSQSISELKALVCAENFPSLTDSHFYISTGLIHLFVVSGAHLVLIERLILMLPLQKKPARSVILIFLGAYDLSCGLNPPVTRSWVVYALITGLQQIRTQWPPHYQLLIAGMLTLIFSPSWIISLSLQLSWIASLLVSINSSQLKHVSLIFRQSLFFVLLFPTLVFFQVPRFSVVLINILLTPVLEFILFPLALTVWFCHFLHPLFDFLILYLKILLNKTEMTYHFQISELPPSLVLWNWLLIFTLHVIFHFAHLKEQRTR